MVAARVDRAIRPWLYSRDYANGLAEAIATNSTGSIRRIVLTGVEDVTETISLPSNCEIVGDARNSASIRVPAGSTFRVFSIDGESNIQIRNIVFSKMSGDALHGLCHAISIRGACEEIAVEDVIADSFPIGIMASGSTGTIPGTIYNLSLRKVKTQNSPSDWGMELSDVNTALIEDCHSVGHWFDGLKLRKRVFNITILGGVYSDNGTSYNSDVSLNGDGIDGYAGADTVKLIGVLGERNNGSAFNFKSGELNRDSSEDYGFVRNLDFIGCTGRLNMNMGINLNLNDQSDLTQPLVSNVSVLGGVYEENGLDGIYVVARNIVINSPKLRRNSRRGLTLSARTMYADLIGVISIGNGEIVAGEANGLGAYINGAKHVSISGGTYLGVDADLITQESDYASLTQYHHYNILVDNDADDVAIRDVKDGYQTGTHGVLVSQSTGDIRHHGRGVGAVTTVGQYGSVGSTRIQTDATAPYNTEWVKVTGHPGQSTTGWIRRFAITTTEVLDFGEIAAGETAELTVGLTGVTFGDMVKAVPATAIASGLIWSSYVSANNTVTVRIANITGSPINPDSTSWRVSGWKQ